jgi:hypothetical protein
MAVLKASALERANHTMERVFGVWAVISVLLFSSGLDLIAQTPSALEYQVKAVFLFNFAQFVDWPTNALPEPQTPLIIGVLGEDPFGAYLDEIVRGEKVNGRPLVVQRYHRVEEVKTCHILFISRSETERLEPILGSLRGRSVLTVGDAIGFAQRGGMIRFMTEKNKIHLRINLEAAKAASLTISSKLLRPAEIVAPGKD